MIFLQLTIFLQRKKDEKSDIWTLGVFTYDFSIENSLFDNRRNSKNKNFSADQGENFKRKFFFNRDKGLDRGS